MFWLVWPLTGYEARCIQTGWSGMDIEPKNIASPMARRSENRSCSKWVRTGGDCSLPEKRTLKRDFLLSIPAVATLQRVWKQDYLPLEKGGSWIADEDRLPAAKRFSSPDDLDASAGAKRSTHGIGYTVHFTQTCDEDLPRLITQVTPTSAPTPDRQALPEIHESLAERELLPKRHLVDAGYVAAEALLASQSAYQVDLVGPTAKDYRGPGTGAKWLRLD